MNHASKELYDKGTFTFSLDLHIADKKVPSKALDGYTFAMNGYRLRYSCLRLVNALEPERAFKAGGP